MSNLDKCRGIVALSQKHPLTPREAAELSKALARLEKAERHKKPGRLMRLWRRLGWAR